MRRDRGLSRQRIQAIHERRFRRGIDVGIIQVRLEDDKLDGPHITIHGGHRVVNFGSCSYLGLGLDARLRDAAADAVSRFGVTHSSSAVYTTLPLYGALEEAISEMVGGYALITPTTTLGHLNALPVLVDDDALVLVDTQAHASLVMTTQVLSSNGADIRFLPHNDLAALDAAATEAGGRQVWYLADGVYSMFGDIAPIEGIADLLDRHDHLHAYIDDAHGFSWQGINGRGVALDRMAFHDRLVLSLSLSKSFGAGGGALAFSSEDVARRVRLLGGPLTFGGPLQTAELGAGVESAAIHLSDEHEDLRARMLDQIDLVRTTADDLGLPIVDRTDTPIWFVRVGDTDHAIEIARRMIDDGFYVNPSTFPAVPMGSAGIRFTHTLLHEPTHIEQMLTRLAHHRSELVDDTHVVIDLTDSALAGAESEGRSDRRSTG